MDHLEAIRDIKAFPLPSSQGDVTVLLQKIILSYLVHHGYSETAEAFSRTSHEELKENLCSIKKRQLIMKLIMSGKIGQAIEQTKGSFPGFLENNRNIMFMLMCRRFIEMVSGSDVDEIVSNKISKKSSENSQEKDHSKELRLGSKRPQESKSQETTINDYNDDVDMDLGYNTNGVESVVPRPSESQVDNVGDFDRILKYGKKIMRMARQMDMERILSDEERQMMADAFSLIAYSNPRSCPLSWQFSQSRREIVCSLLNSLILKSMNKSWPALEVCLAHASELLKLIAEHSCDNHTDFLMEDVFPKK